MRNIAQFQQRPLPEDASQSVAVIEELFSDVNSVFNDLRKYMVEPPAAASSAGLPGQIAYDSDFFYVCIDANTWKRTALSTW